MVAKRAPSPTSAQILPPANGSSIWSRYSSISNVSVTSIDAASTRTTSVPASVAEQAKIASPSVPRPRQPSAGFSDVSTRTSPATVLVAGAIFTTLPSSVLTHTKPAASTSEWADPTSISATSRSSSRTSPAFGENVCVVTGG
jgi:hypothetical protein